MKTLDFIERLKAVYHLPSDYAAAKKLGVTKQNISRIRNHGQTLDDRAAFEIAELLELDPAQVVAYMNLERAERANDKNLILFWQSYAHA